MHAACCALRRKSSVKFPRVSCLLSAALKLVSFPEGDVSDPDSQDLRDFFTLCVLTGPMVWPVALLEGQGSAAGGVRDVALRI